jgi:simple sugar transport system ATP-binding protein
LLRLTAVSKSFGSVQALRGVDLAIAPGEVVGLLGDNGAGKSTLVKIIAGVHAPDSGSLEFCGQRLHPRRYNAAQARRLGIETVYQDRALAEKQPLWRNLFVGRHQTNRLGFIAIGREKRLAMRILTETVGLNGAGLDPDARTTVLSGGERQGLAIGRAMHFKARLVILDEPTTALSLREVDKVLGFVARLKTEGRACIYVSHTLAHVHAAADRFVLLEHGRLTAERDRRDITIEQLGALVQASAAHPLS